MITVSSTHPPHRTYSPDDKEVWASMYVSADDETRRQLFDACSTSSVIENVLVHMKGMSWIVTGVVVEQCDPDDAGIPIRITFNGALRYV